MTRLIALSVALAACGQSTSGGPPQSGAPLPWPAPAPPGGTVEEQVAYFNTLLARPDTRLAGWLGLYDFLGVPVLHDGVPVGTTGDDRFGAAYWQVWYASGLDLPQSDTRLVDAGRLFGVSLRDPDPEAYGALLLDDLSSAARSADPKAKFLGMFVRSRILRGRSHVDILDGSVTPEKAVIDLSSMQLIAWIAMREALSEIAGTVPASPSASATTRELQVVRSRAATVGLDSDLGCSNIWKDEALAVWVIKKLGGGSLLPAVMQRIIKVGLLAKTSAGDIAKAVSVSQPAAEAFFTACSLAMQVSALKMEVDFSPETLVRTTSCMPPGGARGAIGIDLSYDNGILPDGEALWACIGTFVSSAFGLDLEFPPNGKPIANTFVKITLGPEVGGFGQPGGLVTFEERAGFPFSSGPPPSEEQVYALPSFIMKTDANGRAMLDVVGTQQPICLNPPFERVMKQYSFRVSAQVGEVDDAAGTEFAIDAVIAVAQTIAGNPAGMVGVVLDAVKLGAYWGDTPFEPPLQDWEGYPE